LRTSSRGLRLPAQPLELDARLLELDARMLTLLCRLAEGRNARLARCNRLGVPLFERGHLRRSGRPLVGDLAIELLQARSRFVQRALGGVLLRTHEVGRRLRTSSRGLRLPAQPL